VRLLTTRGVLLKPRRFALADPTHKTTLYRCCQISRHSSSLDIKRRGPFGLSESPYGDSISQASSRPSKVLKTDKAVAEMTSSFLAEAKKSSDIQAYGDRVLTLRRVSSRLDMRFFGDLRALLCRQSQPLNWSD
jgi:hypothetical protein